MIFTKQSIYFSSNQLFNFVTVGQCCRALLFLTCYRFVGYFLSAAVVIVAFWATVEIAGGFGPEKSAEWMASFCVSIVESIFMSQPIKVMTNWCASIFF